MDLSTLEKGDIVHLSSIKLPEGVQIPALRLGKEHDLAAVVVKEARVEVEEETAAPAAAAEVPATAVKADAAKTDAAAKAEPGKGKK